MFPPHPLQTLVVKSSELRQVGRNQTPGQAESRESILDSLSQNPAATNTMESKKLPVSVQGELETPPNEQPGAEEEQH